MSGSLYFTNIISSNNSVRQYIYNSIANTHLTLNSDFTIEFWLLGTLGDQPTVPSIFSNNRVWTGTTSSTYTFEVCPTHSGNNLFTIMWVNNLGGGKYTSSTSVLDGNWHNIAITKNNNILKVYIDGLYSYTSLTGITPETWDFSKITIGTNPSDSNININYNGYTSNFRISNTCLYTSNYTVTDQPYQNESSTVLLLNMNYATPLKDSSIYNTIMSYSTTQPTPSNSVVPPFTNNYICFLKGSKILTDKGYLPVECLRKGDLVKTVKHDFVPINMICKKEIYNPANKEERSKDQLYKCSKNKFEEILEDLIITGCHSILVDDFLSLEQRERVKEINGDTYVTDNKYRLPACADERTTVYEEEGLHTIYHLALDHDDYYMNYGIYANGLLVESSSKWSLKENSNMNLIE